MRNYFSPGTVRDMFLSSQINIETLHLYFYVVIIQKRTLKSRYTRTTGEMIDDQRVFASRLLLQGTQCRWERDTREDGFY